MYRRIKLKGKKGSRDYLIEGINWKFGIRSKKIRKKGWGIEKIRRIFR